MKIVVKVGTQSILSEQGFPIEKVMQSIVDEIASLQKKGNKVVLVSSGAVGFGRNIARASLGKEYGVSIGERQLLASLGQHELMNIYAGMFKKHKMLTSQLLLTKQDFYTRQRYLNILRLVKEILHHDNIIPIVNENDTVSIEELMFTDNDELAGLIAAQIDADKLIILSNVEGVYTGHPSEPDAKMIDMIDSEKAWPDISSAKSTQGRGGMISKLSTAKKMSKLGCVTHIASVNQENVINRIVMGESIGTTILASKKKSNIKKWIAYGAHQKSGKIFINAGLCEIIKENKRVLSILPIGIESYRGVFEKGDVVEIFGSNNQLIGIGLARYDSKKLEEMIGKKNQPVFIHYDHLYIY